MSLRLQVSLALMVGLVLGFILDWGRPVLAPAPVGVTATPEIFVTRPDTWMVKVLVRREGSPQIIKVEPLAQGRLSVVPTGEGELQIRDATGQALYSLKFQLHYLGAGEPPRLLDEVELVFVVPVVEGAAEIVLTTPTGTGSLPIKP